MGFQVLEYIILINQRVQELLNLTLKHLRINIIKNIKILGQATTTVKNQKVSQKCNLENNKENFRILTIQDSSLFPDQDLMKIQEVK